MTLLQRTQGWALTHPKTMTYIAVISTLNFCIAAFQVVTGH